jgi:hypothetical protein
MPRTLDVLGRVNQPIRTAIEVSGNFHLTCQPDTLRVPPYMGMPFYKGRGFIKREGVFIKEGGVLFKRRLERSTDYYP